MAQAVLKQTRIHRRRAQSFESLVQAGLKVIGQRGLYETTVEHITEAADVGKGTFYAHFASKEDLVFHLVRHGFDELIAARTTEPSFNGTGAPAARLAALIQGQLRALGRRRDLIILLHQIRGLLILQPGARRRLRQEYRRYVQFLMEECQRSLGNPALGQAQMRDLACAIAGFVSGTLSFEILVRESRDPAPALTRPVNAFAAGIASRYLPSPSRATGTRRPGGAHTSQGGD
jgi:AcrR family transcriptional regulator